MNHRILLVSHNRIPRITYGAILTRAGHEVTPVNDAEAALIMLRRFKFDLVLVGIDSLPLQRPIEKRIRQEFPEALILKVDDTVNSGSLYCASSYESSPDYLLDVLEMMLATQRRPMSPTRARWRRSCLKVIECSR